MICEACACEFVVEYEHVCAAALASRLARIEAINAWYGEAVKAGALAPYTYGSVMCGGCHEPLEVLHHHTGFRVHDCPAKTR